MNQINHIIPQDISPARLQELRGLYGLPIDFDLYDPCNLAPICIPCNGLESKGNATYEAPIVLTRLKAAHKRRPGVIAHVRKFGQSGKVAEHLLQAATADLSDPGIRKEFLEHAPAVVQILAMTDQGLEAYRSFRLVEVAVRAELGDYQRVDVALDNRARTAVALLEEVCESSLNDVLNEPVVQLVEEVCDRVTAAFEALESQDPIAAGEPTGGFVTISVDSFDFRRFADAIEFTFGGAFEASLSASLVCSRPDGDGTDELQGDAVVSRTFSTVAVWDLAADPAGVTAGDCIIGAWIQDLRTAR
ncbi:hypothetical protein ACICHK_41660 (plasmid) [Streptomyces sp. AHU1]|uniref:hypothetical protein n=1 Tax=Streptomyces sp. AHU1 TaxID=3377215 RepID=UPI003877D17A